MFVIVEELECDLGLGFLSLLSLSSRSSLSFSVCLSGKSGGGFFYYAPLVHVTSTTVLEGKLWTQQPMHCLIYLFLIFDF